MERLQNKLEEVTSKKQNDKNIRIDEEKVASCPDGTPADDMEEGVGDEKYDKNERIYSEKEAKCPDVTPPDDMEEGV